jgi:hypothetical protein
MMKMTLLLFFFSLSTFASTLPDIFYANREEQEAFCSTREFQNELFWRKLINNKISALTEESSQIIHNSYVSLSYLEFFKLHGQYPPAAFAGYVYANASHHLGRLIRFKQWPKDHILKENDRKLVKGVALRAAAGLASQELSERLMHHSLSLYKELAWSLASASLCGPEYTRRIVKDVNLREAYAADTISDFILPFITYEQTYLQETMYNEWIIANTARWGILDEMRFISFNGQENLSFKAWCELTDCKTSSYNLKNRITFDSVSIKNELKLLLLREESLLQRSKRAKIEETAEVFIK